MAKTNGAEFKRFYNDSQYWPENAFHEDETLLVDGAQWTWAGQVEDIPDSAQIDILGGLVHELADGTEPTFEAFFQQWQRGTVRNLTAEDHQSTGVTLFELTDALNASASNDGCDSDLTVVSAEALHRLMKFVESMPAKRDSVRKLTAEDHQPAGVTISELTDALNASASNDGCDPELTVISAQALHSLVQFVKSMTA